MSCDDDDPRPSPRLDGGCRRWRPEAASFRGDTPSSDITGLAHFRRAIIDCDERCWSEIIAIRSEIHSLRDRNPFASGARSSRSRADA